MVYCDKYLCDVLTSFCTELSSLLTQSNMLHLTLLYFYFFRSLLTWNSRSVAVDAAYTGLFPVKLQKLQSDFLLNIQGARGLPSVNVQENELKSLFWLNIQQVSDSCL